MLMHNLFYPLLLALIVLNPATAATTQRSNFLAAEQAYNRGDLGLYHSLKPGLNDYPLYPYLEYRELKKRLDTASSSEVSKFLTNYSGSGPAYLLRGRWLSRLASEGRWEEFIKNYDKRDDSDKLRCLVLDALIHTDNSDLAYSHTEEIWLHGDSLPDACDAVFESWRKAGNMESTLVWRRIELAMQSGHVKLAGHLGKYLSAADKKWLNRWINMRSNPAKALSSLSGSHPFKAEIIGYGLRRLGNKSPEKALSRWKQLLKKSDYSANDRCVIDQGLAQALYTEAGKNIYSFYLKTGTCLNHPVLLQARLRAALLRQDWKQLLTWIDAMPDELRQQQLWRYWKARALEQNGYRAAAAALFNKVARDRSFYAYLASDHIPAPYKFAHAEIAAGNTEISSMKTDPAMLRMRELQQLGRNVDLRREWRQQMQQLDKPAMQTAAVVFNEWGMLDRAIFTLAEANSWDDLEMRFPLEHRELIEKYARQRGIDASWAFAILRQESAFMAEIKSAAGAHGLMQLLPATARQVAHQLEMKRPSVGDLNNPATNIALGTGYLGMMMKRFGNNMTLSTAAYNAGPGAVKKWLDHLPNNTPLPADIWVELIPYKETRKYVKHVMTYATIYDMRLGVKQMKISGRLGVIPQ